MPLPPADRFEALDQRLRSVQALEGVYATWQTDRFPYPIYAEPVRALFAELGRADWIDPGYDPGDASRLIHQAGYLEDASFDQLRPLITYCVRIERFGDGNWEALLREGTLFRLTGRLFDLYRHRNVNNP